MDASLSACLSPSAHPFICEIGLVQVSNLFPWYFLLGTWRRLWAFTAVVLSFKYSQLSFLNDEPERLCLLTLRAKRRRKSNICGLQATEALLWELKFPHTLPQRTRELPPLDATGDRRVLGRPWLPVRAKRFSFRKEKQEIINIDSRDKAGHGRKRRGKMEKIKKKKMGGKDPKEYPLWLRTAHWLTLCSLWDLPIFRPKGNCGHSPVFHSQGNCEGSYLQGHRDTLWFAEKGQVCFPIWTPPPMAGLCFYLRLPCSCIFSLLIYNSKGTGRVVSERPEILKNKLTICHSFEKRSGSCGFSHFYVITVQHILMEGLLGSDYVPGALLYQLQCWAHWERGHI